MEDGYEPLGGMLRLYTRRQAEPPASPVGHADWWSGLATNAAAAGYHPPARVARCAAVMQAETTDPVTCHSRVLIAPAAFAQPNAWMPSEPRNHGGADRNQSQRPAAECATCGPDAPVVQEHTVVTRTLCGSCDTELTEHTFTQERTTIWPTKYQVDGCPAEPIADSSEAPPNQQVAEPSLPSSPAAHVAGWGGSSHANEGAVADHQGCQHPLPTAVSPAPARRLIPRINRDKSASCSRNFPHGAQSGHGSI